MDVIGTDATERTGMLWTLSYQDHPARKLALSPKKLAVGVSTIVSVSMQIV